MSEWDSPWLHWKLHHDVHDNFQWFLSLPEAEWGLNSRCGVWDFHGWTFRNRCWYARVSYFETPVLWPLRKPERKRSWYLENLSFPEAVAYLPPAPAPAHTPHHGNVQHVFPTRDWTRAPRSRSAKSFGSVYLFWLCCAFIAARGFL